MATVNEKMTAIADAIREKTGGTEALTLDDMASGVNEVFDAGKHQEWSDFWDVLQGKGARTDYYYGFYSEYYGAWNDKNFKPKYDFRPTDMTRFMRRAGITNWVELCKRQGIVLDSSNCKRFSLAFGHMNALEVMCPLDISKNTESTHSAEIFSMDTRLHTIEKLIVSETTYFTEMFYYCLSLKNIVFEGTIGHSISFSYSPLTVESMKSIISCLKDYSTDETNQFKYTLTLKADCWTNLEAEGETSPDGTTWLAYVESKGWNRA